MSVTVYFANVSKKRNSTYRGTFNVSYDCVLKAPTSLDRPIFLVSAATMDYNAAKYGDRYYFIDDVVSVRQGQWEVSCILDVLATYKTEIQASTQFVTYSSSMTSEWLTDPRIPVETAVPFIDKKNKSFTNLFSSIGFYVLTVNGKDGCIAYCVDILQIMTLISNVNTWKNDGINAIMSGGDQHFVYDFSSPEGAIEAFSKISLQTGFIGNAYANAPQMIRSCIWVPFNRSTFEEGNLEHIYLGEFDTGVQAKRCKTDPETDFIKVDIPWKYSDWRRSTCETVYLYLPFVGNISLSSDEISGSTELAINYSATATDGVICYQVNADSLIVGTYGGSCCANYPIGINQQASAGAIAQTAFSGAEKMVSMAINSSLSPASMAGVVAGESLAGIQTAYDIQNVRHSTNPSCIGAFSGGAGAGLSLDAFVCLTSCRTSCDPIDMVATMGYPTMKPMSLSGLSGFCQCANAHVAAAAQARELDAIDTYLNTGFFIE